MDKDDKELQLPHNPMLAEAEPLLQRADQYSERDYRSICQSITQFENHCKDAGYSRSEIDDACFFLCAFLDEMFSWEKPLLNNFYENGANKDNKFYDRLALRKNDPHNNIDLLELAYVCFSLGFCGKYQNTPPGNGVITVMGSLYSSIRDVRGDVIPHLSSTYSESGERFWRSPPIWVTVIVALVILFSIFFPYSKRLTQYATPALQTLQNITKTDVGTNEN